MHSPLRYLSPTSVTVRGFYRNWLTHQKEGLTGHIGEVFSDLSDASGWLGGDGESWERGPYYLDGLISLAFLLDDKQLKARVEKWVRSIRASQTPDGNFGPKILLDWWPKLVVTKALVTYYRSTKNGEILKFLQRFFDYMIKELPTKPLFFWAYARGLEASEAIELVYDYTHEEKYRTLALTLRDASLDWESYFRDFSFPHKTTHYLNKTLFTLARPMMMKNDEKEKKHPKAKTAREIASFNQSTIIYRYLRTHGVNLAMALKYPIWSRFWQGQNLRTDALWADYRNVLDHHGNALGLFSSDEHLNGTSPLQGVELCVVVEAMYSMEEILRLSRDPIAADYLESYLYNALPATITNDFSAHQYCQQPNQLHALVKRNPFFDADKTATTFGVAPNYGCCAANMHQGFPKAVNAAVLYDDDSFSIFLYISGTYDIPFKDGTVHVEVKTEYPFSDHVLINIETTKTAPKTMILRLPYGVKTLIVAKGQETLIDDGRHVYEAEGVCGDATYSLTFYPEFKTVLNPDKSYSLKRGPLLFALPLDYEEVYLKGPKPFHDRGYAPKKKTPKVLLDLIDGKFLINDFQKAKKADDFYHFPMSVTVQGHLQGNSQTTGFKLIPYGQTILRISQFKVRRIHAHAEK